MGNVSEETYDLVLKGGRVFDSHQGIWQFKDVAIKNDRVALMEKGIPDNKTIQSVDVTNKLVTPGLVDLHTHVYRGANVFGVDADSLGAQSGVTTMVDAGSAGPINFEAFKELVIDRSKVRIRAFLHIAWAGLSTAVYRPQDMVICGELNELRYAVVRAAVETARKYPDNILGIKVRLGLDASGTQGIKPLHLALEAAEEIGKPVMVHISFPPPTRREVLPLLRKGDILTHVFRASPNGPLDGGGHVIPEMIAARDRGVIMDTGHGGGSFSFDVARRMIEAGFPPDVISSDFHALSRDIVVDLPTTMSKMLTLGMDLERVIEAATWVPGQIICPNGGIGTLKEAVTGDISVFDLEKGVFQYRDGFGNTISSEQRFKPLLTIIRGKVVSPESD